MSGKIVSIVDRRRKQRIDTILYTRPGITTLGDFVTTIKGVKYIDRT